VLAVHDVGLFELDTSNTTPICTPVTAPCGDANVANDAGAPGDDWADVFAGTQSTSAIANGSTFITDPTSSAENSFYTGGGSKDVNEAEGSWQYATTNDVVPDKDDISHAFAAAYKTAGATPDTIIYFGMDRYANNGDSETGFWFFKGKVTLGAGGQFVGKHQPGDVLVLADWGGSNPVGDITVYEWQGGKNPLKLVSDNATADCAKVTNNDNYCAVVNRRAVTQPWSFTDKDGSTTLQPLELFEAGLNVTKTFGGDRCFSSFLAATRSSHSTTAQLKDFALGGFEQCGAAIKIEPSATNEVGQPHTFTVTVSKSVAGTNTPVQGVKPVVTLTAANGAVIKAGSVDNCASTGTDVNGKCTVVFTSDTGGTVTGHAKATVTIGTDNFVVETDGKSPNSGDAVKTFVDANIKITPTQTNEVGTPHTFTVTIKQDSGNGSGLVNVPNGTKPTVTLTAANGAAIKAGSVDNCATTGTTSGSCTVVFNSDTGGTITGHASITLTLAGKSVSRATDGKAPNSADAVKTYVDANIKITPTQTNEVGTAHTFTVTVKQDNGSGAGLANVPNGTKPTVTLTAAKGAVIKDTTNNCASTGTVSGSCTVVFNSDFGGTITGHASITLTLANLQVTRATDGTHGSSDDAVKTYVDANIKITPAATNEVGQTHTFTVTIKQDSGNGSGLVGVPNGTKPTVTLTASNGAVVKSTVDNCATTGTVSGACTVSFTSAIAGKVTGHASITLTLAGKSVSRSTDGTGQNSNDVVKTFVNAYITIGPAEATNTVGDPHTFTVEAFIDKGDNAGWVHVPDTTLITVTLTDTDGATHSTSSDSCATGGTVAGLCYVVFSSPTAGTVTGHAKLVITVDTVQLTRETDGKAPNSGDAVKHFVAGSVVWTKVDNAGRKQGGATFTVCKTHNYNLVTGLMDDIADVCSDVTDNAAPDTDGDKGEFKLAGLSLGRYTVKEKTAPAGYLPDPSTKSVDLIPGDSDKSISTAFVNSREILKITGFGYTNEAVGALTDGIVTGKTVFTVNLKNYGTAPANLTHSSLVVSSANKTDGTLTCDGTGTDGLTLSMTDTIAAGATSSPYVLTCNYVTLNDGAQVIADLVVNSTTNNLEREASGSPARIRFTIQAD